MARGPTSRASTASAESDAKISETVEPLDTTEDAVVVKSTTDSPKRRVKPNTVVKRDPNEEISSNWQRRMHVSDRMTAPDLTNALIIDGTKLVVTGTGLAAGGKPEKTEPEDVAGDGESNDTILYEAGEYVFVVRPELDLPTPTTPIEQRDDPARGFRIARIMGFSKSKQGVLLAEVNWLVRPREVLYFSRDSREQYLTFQHEQCEVSQFRGKCIVQARNEMRNFARYREKACQFWFGHLFDRERASLWPVVTVASMKSLGTARIYELGLVAYYAVVKPDTTAKLCEAPRRGKMSAAALAAEMKDSLEPSPAPEIPEDPKELAELEQKRTLWPFRFYDGENQEFAEPCVLPKPSIRLGENYQVQVDDWPGQSLVYYTNVNSSRITMPRTTSSRTRSLSRARTSSRTAPRLRLVEPPREGASEEDMYEVDASLPWVQEMPQGYIARGSSSTSIPMSHPEKGLNEFVIKCREKYAKPIGVDPCNLNFLDACCSMFEQCEGNAHDALAAMARFNRKQLNEPDLKPADVDKFRAALNPFLQHSWHEIFKIMGSIPFTELCQYLWVNMPSQPAVMPQQMQWEQDPDGATSVGEEIDEDDGSNSAAEQPFKCVICATEEAPGWKALPGYVPLLDPKYVEEASEDHKLAFCARCARLWFRYRVRWLPSLETEVMVAKDSSYIEPELIEDSKNFISETEKRAKRRQAALDKKETATKKRLEAKKAKLEKKLAKVGGSNDIDVSSIEKQLDATAEEMSKIEKKKAEAAAAPSSSVTKAAAQIKSKKTSEKAATSATARKRKKSEKVVAEEKQEQDTKHEEEEEEEASDEEKSKPASKKRNPVTTGISLDMVDGFIAAMNEGNELEKADVPKYCVVCGQLDASMDQASCISCGLHVHFACYGAVSFDSQGTPWRCDCCRNLRGELSLDNNYQCVLCYPHTPKYSQWLNGDKVGQAPDALKGTIDKHWAHVRCAMWTPGVKFADTRALNGISVKDVPAEIWAGECSICMTNSSAVNQRGATTVDAEDSAVDSSPAPSERVSNRGVAAGLLSCSEVTAKLGAKVKCELCDERFHVSCAVDRGYNIGITKSKPFRAVVICSRHDESSFVPLLPMSLVDQGMSSTAMQIYARENHATLSPHSCVSGIDRAAHCIHKDRDFIKKSKFTSTTSVSRVVVPESGGQLLTPAEVKAVKLNCINCGTRNASYWIRKHENVVLCAVCLRYPEISATGQSQLLNTEYLMSMYNEALINSNSS